MVEAEHHISAEGAERNHAGVLLVAYLLEHQRIDLVGRGFGRNLGQHVDELSRRRAIFIYLADIRGYGHSLRGCGEGE